jgi:hypothetical protein
MIWLAVGPEVEMKGIKEMKGMRNENEEMGK